MTENNTNNYKLLNMKAIYIYPEDIGASGEWSDDWIKFIKKLGYKDGDRVWGCVLVAPIETDN